MTDLTQFLTAQRREIIAVRSEIVVADRKVREGKISEARLALDMAKDRLNSMFEAQDAAIKLAERAALPDVEVEGEQ